MILPKTLSNAIKVRHALDVYCWHLKIFESKEDFREPNEAHRSHWANQRDPYRE